MLAADPTDVTFRDPAIVESSGLVARDGLFVTVNDSGDRGRIFTVDRSGRTVGTTSWSPDPVDDEALAPATGRYVWVGDIGDNSATRSSITVLRVPFGRGDRTVTPPAYTLVYPDGARDAETLLAAPDGRLLVVSKELFGGAVYAAPRHLSPDRPNRLRKVVDAGAFVTDGAFFPDGRHLVLRDYGRAAIYTYPGFDRVAELRLPDQPQGEGIAIAEDGTAYVSSEGVHSSVLPVTSVSVWGWVDRAVAFVADAVRLLLRHGAAA